ncbi:MAG TPA: DUF1579 family protein [Thermoanaerobaculia bacterium]|nr:DUF1579 family protein [Thermoanaerobaculia bacterium]
MNRKTLSVPATLLAIAGLLCATRPVGAESSPCSGPEWKALDFWVGEWRATWPGTPGNPAGSATNRIEKILGGCVVSENFTGDGENALVGKSWSTYEPKTKAWRQTWVDNQASYLDFTGDFSHPNEKIFAMDAKGPDGRPVKLRMVFKNIGKDAFDWSWERSADGGKSWEVRWPIHYTRKKR